MQRLFAALFLLCSFLGHAQSVTVDASVNVVLGGQPEIPGSLFGLTAFEGGPAMVADADYYARVAALRPGCSRYAGNARLALGFASLVQTTTVAR